MLVVPTMMHRGTSRGACASTSSSEQQKPYDYCRRHATSDVVDATAAGAFTVDTQAPESYSMPLPPLPLKEDSHQQQLQHPYSHYSYTYIGERQKRSQQKVATAQREKEEEDLVGQQQHRHTQGHVGVLQGGVYLGQRGGSRSRSGSSLWWEERPLLPRRNSSGCNINVVTYAQGPFHVSSGSSDSSSSSASSSRSRVRRFSSHNVGGLVHQQHPYSGATNARNRVSSYSIRQQSGIGSFSSARDQEDLQEQTVKQKPVTYAMSATLMTQSKPQTYNCPCVFSVSQPEDSVECFEHFQSFPSKSYEGLRKKDWPSLGQAMVNADEGHTTSFYNSAGHQRLHRRHGILRSQQLQEVNEILSSSSRSSTRTNTGGVACHTGKPEGNRVEKQTGEVDIIPRYRHRWEDSLQHEYVQQQQQREGGAKNQKYSYNVREDNTRTSGRRDSTLIYQWQRRVLEIPPPPPEDPLQQRMRSQIVATGLQIPRQQQHDVAKENEGEKNEQSSPEKSSSSEKSSHENTLYEKSGVEDHCKSAESKSFEALFTVVCEVQSAPVSAKINGCIRQTVSPRNSTDDEENDDEEDQEEMDEEDHEEEPMLQKDQLQQQRKLHQRRRRKKKGLQQRQERQRRPQQEQTPLLIQQKQHCQVRPTKHQQKQSQTSKQKKPHQHPISTSYRLQRKISPTTLEEGLQFERLNDHQETEEQLKQQNRSKACQEEGSEDAISGRRYSVDKMRCESVSATSRDIYYVVSDTILSENYRDYDSAVDFSALVADTFAAARLAAAVAATTVAAVASAAQAFVAGASAVDASVDDACATGAAAGLTETNCLSHINNTSLHAEEAVCAWLFDILVAHLEGQRGQPEPPKSILRMHQEQVRCPAFVTWMKKKREDSSFERVDVELRGCIGSLSPIPVLEIGEYALTSALRDKRFRPIALREIPYLACYVSLLHSYEDAKHPLDWEIGVHGTTIKYLASDGQTYTATYLPEVAKELGMTQTEALTSLFLETTAYVCLYATSMMLHASSCHCAASMPPCITRPIKKSGYLGAIPENYMSRLSVTRYRSSQARLDYDTYLRRYGRYNSS